MYQILVLYTILEQPELKISISFYFFPIFLFLLKPYLGLYFPYFFFLTF